MDARTASRFARSTAPRAAPPRGSPNGGLPSRVDDGVKGASLLGSIDTPSVDPSRAACIVTPRPSSCGDLDGRLHDIGVIPRLRAAGPCERSSPRSSGSGAEEVRPDGCLHDRGSAPARPPGRGRSSTGHRRPRDSGCLPPYRPEKTGDTFGNCVFIHVTVYVIPNTWHRRKGRSTRPPHPLISELIRGLRSLRLAAHLPLPSAGPQPRRLHRRRRGRCAPRIGPRIGSADVGPAGKNVGAPLHQRRVRSHRQPAEFPQGCADERGAGVVGRAPVARRHGHVRLGAEPRCRVGRQAQARRLHV